MSFYSTLATPTSAYPSTPDVTVPFEPRAVTFALMDSVANQNAFISFDGVNNHVKLVVGQLQTVRLESAVTKIWLKSAVSTSVQVIAEK